MRICRIGAVRWEVAPNPENPRLFQGSFCHCERSAGISLRGHDPYGKALLHRRDCHVAVLLAMTLGRPCCKSPKLENPNSDVSPPQCGNAREGVPHGAAHVPTDDGQTRAGVPSPAFMPGDGTPAELSARVSREDGVAGIGDVLRWRAYRRELPGSPLRLREPS